MFKTQEEYTNHQRTAPDLSTNSEPSLKTCCKDKENLFLFEHRENVVAVWKCKECGCRHFRAFVPPASLNIPIGG